MANLQKKAALAFLEHKGELRLRRPHHIRIIPLRE